MGNSTSKQIDSRAVARSEYQRKMQLREQMRELADDSDVDFYELFGLPRYCDVTEEEHRQQLRAKYHELAMIHHPDRGGDEDKMQKLVHAKGVLLNPETKRLYDAELRKKYDESKRPGGWRYWARWISSMAMFVAGGCVIAGGIMAAPVTFGASAAFGCTGGALVSAGFSGMVSQYKDPNKSDVEFLKTIGVSAIAGAVGGCIGAGSGIAIANGVISAGAKVGIAAVSGASTAAAGYVMDNAVDLAITEGKVGEYLQENISGCKTKDKIFSKKNAMMFAGTVAFGALTGGVCQAAANGISQAASNAAAEVVDDIAVNVGKAATTIMEDIVELAPKALPTLAKTGVKAVEIGTMAVIDETHDALQKDPDLSFGDALKHGASRAIGDKLKHGASKLAKVFGDKPTEGRTGKGAKVFGDKGAKVTKPEATKPKATKPGNTKTSKVRPQRMSFGASSHSELSSSRRSGLGVPRSGSRSRSRTPTLSVFQAAANGISQTASNVTAEVVDDIVVNVVVQSKKALPTLAESGVKAVGIGTMAVVEETYDARQNDSDLSFGCALKHGVSRAIGDKLKPASKSAKVAKTTKVRTGKGAKVTKPKATEPGNTETSKVRPPRKSNGKKSRNAPTSNQLRAEKAKQLRVDRAKQLRVERAKQLRVERAKQLRVERAKQRRVERAKQRRDERAKQLRNSPH